MSYTIADITAAQNALPCINWVCFKPLCGVGRDRMVAGCPSHPNPLRSISRKQSPQLLLPLNPKSTLVSTHLITRLVPVTETVASLLLYCYAVLLYLHQVITLRMPYSS